MIKRYCDRCGQQIDEGVHAWYVLELHGTGGEFRHKELCEECYEYLCEKDEVPKADRKTEKCSEIPNNCETCKYGEDKHRYAHICNECGVGINNYEPKTEPQTCDDCIWNVCNYNKAFEDEPQKERSSE